MRWRTNAIVAQPTENNDNPDPSPGTWQNQPFQPRWRTPLAWCMMVVFGGLCLWLYQPWDPADAIRRSGGTVQAMTLPKLKGRMAVTLPDTVGDEGLERMTALDRLKPVFIQLRGRQITGRGVVALQRFPELYGLVLWGTSITDDDLAHLAAFPNLTVLNLEANHLSVRALEHLKNLPSLRSVSLYATGLPTEAVLRFQAEHKNILVIAECTKKDDD